MQNQFFKSFYKLDLAKKDILEKILKNKLPDVLKTILEDTYYYFDKNFVFNHIAELIKQRDLGKALNLEELEILITNIIKYDLYNTNLVKLLAWFISNFEFFEAFK